MPTVLITGAGRGLGLEFATQYAHAGYTVHATSRQSPEDNSDLRELQRRYPRHVRLHQLDLESDTAIDALSASLRDESIDLLINNAAYGRKSPDFPATDEKSWRRSMRVNAFAMLKMASAFHRQVARSQDKTMVALSSEMGSIARNTTGGRYNYRASKAALNMIIKSLAVDLASLGICVVSLHPGWVKTAMGGPDAQLTPIQSVERLRKIIAELSPSCSGRFFSYDGAEIPW